MSYLNENGFNKKFIITSTFPYNMIPAKLWDSRMKMLKHMGFNCIDIYFLWNYHELAEGEWNFSENRDIEKLIKLAKKNGFNIIAHPGPHVGLLWDGGGAPPFLLAKMNSSARSVNNVYFDYIAIWYNKILPIIKNYEFTDIGYGPIIGMEIELSGDEFAQLNASTIKKILAKYKFAMPLDINVLKMPDKSKTINSCGTLKQKIVTGHKLLRAKNYVGGVSADFYNTIKNNGYDGAFVAAAFNENVIISPFGEINNVELSEMRLLRMLLNMFNEELFSGQLALNTTLMANGENSKSVGIDVYRLKDSGIIIACTNNSTKKADIVISDKNNAFPTKTSINILPGHCRYILKNYSLLQLGIAATVEYCTAEVLCYKKVGNILYIMLCVDIEGEFCVHGDNITVISGDMMYIATPETKSITTYFSSESYLRLDIGGEKVRIITFSKETASTIYSVDEKGIMSCVVQKGIESEGLEIVTAKNVTVSVSDAKLKLDFRNIPDNASNYLEANGIYKGFAMYEADVMLAEEVRPGFIGIVAHRASDILSIFINGRYVMTCAPFGEHIFIEISSTETIILDDLIIEAPVKISPNIKFNTQKGTVNKIGIKAEIWGHSSTGLPNPPALKPGAMKGLRSLSLVTSKKEIEKVSKLFVKSAGSYGVYLCGNATVNINGKSIACNYRKYGYVDVTPYIRLKADNEISVLGDTYGKIYFIEGIKAQNYRIAEISQKTFYETIAASDEILKTSLPFELQRGSDRFISFSLNFCKPGKSYKAVVTGNGIKVTALFNGNITGRMWLSGGAPEFLHGISDTVYLPSSMFVNDISVNTVTFYVEGVSGSDSCILSNVQFMPVETAEFVV